MPQLPNIRGGNDPTRAALLNMLSRGRVNAPAPGGAPAAQPRPQMAVPGMAPQQAVPQGAGLPPRSGGEHLAEALKAFAESGFTPSDIEAIREFYFVLKEIIAPFESTGASPTPPQAQEMPRMGFNQVPSQAAQNAPVSRGVRGY